MLVRTAGVTVTLADGAMTPFNDAEMPVLPTADASATPVWMPTLAFAGLTDDQSTCVVRLAVLPSEYVPMADRLTFVPLGSVVEAGVMVMLPSVAAMTVMLAVFEVMPFNAALTVVIPTAAPTRLPVLAPIVAVNGSAEDQMTCDVTSAVVPSEYVPVAVRLVLAPLASVAPAVMVMLFSTAAVTVTLATGDMMPFKDALTAAEPTATPVTVPVLAPTVAVAGETDVQVTWVLMSELLPSE
jgi:hypothetical protein